jgi:uncharacterized circularly permuted ATP-grasp superfamily protein
VVRYENQPVWVIEVQRELTLAVSFQLVQAPCNVSQILQARRRTERIEPRAKQLGSTAALRAYQRSLLIALLLEFSLFKQDIHKSILCQGIVNVLR